MSTRDSYRQLLRSSSIIGGASVINIAVALVRTKVAAVLLGPSGVGLIGLLQSLMATAAVVSSLGFGTVGTRQIAEAAARQDTHDLDAARRALFWGTLSLALIGGAVFWGLRHVLAAQVFDDPSVATTVGWLSVGVALTVASGSQGALLSGLRRVGDIARLSIGAALLSAATGMTAIWVWGDHGVLVFVLASPLASFLLGHWYVGHLPKVGAQATPIRVLAGEWKSLARLGVAFMVSGIVVTAGILMVRTLVQRELGSDALGHFQAAWTISMTYIGFVLGAMGTDFYPRLTAQIHDHSSANRLVNEQSEVALVLAGPVFVLMIGLAPWVIESLYSVKFNDAIWVLRWQVLGDVLKIVSWPLGFIILAAGDGRTFMLTESMAIITFVGLTWLGLPLVGIQATGIAFLAMYALHIPIVYWLAWRRTQFRWERRIRLHLIILAALTVSVFVAAIWSQWIAAGMGISSAVGLSLYGLIRLGEITEAQGSLGKLASVLRRICLTGKR